MGTGSHIINSTLERQGGVGDILQKGGVWPNLKVHGGSDGVRSQSKSRTGTTGAARISRPGQGSAGTLERARLPRSPNRHRLSSSLNVEEQRLPVRAEGGAGEFGRVCDVLGEVEDLARAGQTPEET